MAIHYRTFTIAGGASLLFLMGVLNTSASSTSRDTITYSKEIRKLIATRCASCHQPGGSAPFSLLTFQDVKRRAELIRYVSILKIMPPLDAVSDVDTLINHEPLTDSELIDIQFWVKAGMPEGDPTLPIPVEPANPLKGEVIDSKQVSIKSEGAPYTEVLEFEKPLSTKALTAFSIHPKEPRAVRYVVLARIDPDMDAGEVFTPKEWKSEYLIGAWAPGYSAWTNALPGPDTTRTKLVALVTYMPTGKLEPGALQVGLNYQEGADTKSEAIVWKRLGKSDFVIPARDELTTLTDEIQLDQDYQLASLVPQFRRYAREVKVTATAETGESKSVLNVFTWDYQWPGAYNFSKLPLLKKGTKLKLEVVYDNSGHAFGNERLSPLPVKFGIGEDDEQMWMHLQLIPVTKKDKR